jgi:uncharacterized protein with WD repeat
MLNLKWLYNSYMRVIFVLVIFIASLGLQNLQSQTDNPLTLDNQDSTVITSENAEQLVRYQYTNPDLKLVSMSPNSAYVAVVTQHVDWDYEINIMDSTTQEIILQIQGRMDSFKDLFWSSTNRIAVLSSRWTPAGMERTAKTYTIEEGEPSRYFSGKSDLYVFDFIYSPTIANCDAQFTWNPTGELFAVILHDELNVFDVSADEPIYSVTLEEDVCGIEWTSNGKFIIVKYFDNNTDIFTVQVN